MSAKSTRPYSRCYYVDLERDYPTVYHDDHLFATYMRLLNFAEASWPALPEIPRSARTRPVEALIKVGLVIRCDGYHYRIKGLDVERNARATAGRTGAEARWGNADRNADRTSDGNAEGNAIAMPKRTEPNLTEIPPPPAERGRRADETNPRATGDNPRANGTSPRQRGESPRQEREAEKRGPTLVGEIIAGWAARGADR